MYSLNDVKVLHLEITEKCQAGCPFCARYLADGSDNPLLKNAELSLSDCRKYFSKEFVKQLQGMYMCGTYGDPIIARDTLDVFEYFRYNNPFMSLSMHTNGGARDRDWWKDLASVMYNEYSDVIFSIDGLQDTNHIYRKRVNWNKVLDSAESFIEAGGNATWSFLVFRHNEHQVDEARRMSKKMGFKKFVAKKSSRFANERGKNSVDLMPPRNKQYQNAKIEQTAKLIEMYGSLDEFYNQTTIDCLAVSSKSIYVSARGLLFPCSWIGSLYEDRTLEEFKQVEALYGSFDRVDLNKTTIEDVFNSGIFDDIKKRWSCQSISAGKLKTCSMTCSKEHNLFKAQF